MEKLRIVIPLLCVMMISACSSQGNDIIGLRQQESSTASSLSETSEQAPPVAAETEPSPQENKLAEPAAKDYCIYPDVSEAYPYIISEERVGTQQELVIYSEILNMLQDKEIVVFASDYVPSDYSGTYPLSEDDVSILLSMLKEIELDLLPADALDGNPPTGGWSSYYIETQNIKMHLTIKPGFAIFIIYPETGISLAFKEASYNGLEPGPAEYLYQKQQGNDVIVGRQ